jgi:hypothetical protein
VHTSLAGTGGTKIYLIEATKASRRVEVSIPTTGLNKPVEVGTRRLGLRQVPLLGCCCGGFEASLELRQSKQMKGRPGRPSGPRGAGPGFASWHRMHCAITIRPVVVIHSLQSSVSRIAWLEPHLGTALVCGHRQPGCATGLMLLAVRAFGQ